jgi:hypothetical protein
MWEPQRLTTLWACTACYRNSFTFLLPRKARYMYICSYLRSWALPKKLPIVQPFREFPAIWRNTKVHHRVHKRPPPVPVLNQFDPVHTISSYLCKIHFNIVLVFLVVSFLLAFPPISYTHSSSPSIVLHACITVVPHHFSLHFVKYLLYRKMFHVEHVFRNNILYSLLVPNSSKKRWIIF